MISTYMHFNLLKNLTFFHKVLNTYYEILDPLKTMENSHQFQLLISFATETYYIAVNSLKYVESCGLKPFM